MKINKINEEDDSRIAGGVELADNYETILATKSEIRNNGKYMKIINILKDKPPMTNKQIAIAYEEILSTDLRRPKKSDDDVDPASVNRIIIELKEAGVVIGTGLVSPKAGKSSVNAPGVKGRPKLTNDEIKTLGDGVIRKFSKGQTNFTSEEINFITQLYNATTSTSEEEIDEILREEQYDHTAKSLFNMFKQKGLTNDRREYDVEDLMAAYPGLSEEEAEKLEDMLQNNPINESRWAKLAGLL